MNEKEMIAHLRSQLFLERQKIRRLEVELEATKQVHELLYNAKMIKIRSQVQAKTDELAALAREAGHLAGGAYEDVSKLVKEVLRKDKEDG